MDDFIFYEFPVFLQIANKMRFQSVWRMEDFAILFLFFLLFLFSVAQFLRSSHTIVTKRLTQMLNIVDCLYRVRRQRQQVDDKCFRSGEPCCSRLVIGGISVAIATTARARMFHSVVFVCADTNTWTRSTIMHRACDRSVCLFVCFFLLVVLFGYRCKLQIGRHRPVMAYWNRCSTEWWWIFVFHSFWKVRRPVSSAKLENAQRQETASTRTRIFCFKQIISDKPNAKCTSISIVGELRKQKRSIDRKIRFPFDSHAVM